MLSLYMLVRDQEERKTIPFHLHTEELSFMQGSLVSKGFMFCGVYDGRVGIYIHYNKRNGGCVWMLSEEDLFYRCIR